MITGPHQGCIESSIESGWPCLLEGTRPSFDHSTLSSWCGMVFLRYSEVVLFQNKHVFSLCGSFSRSEQTSCSGTFLTILLCIQVCHRCCSLSFHRQPNQYTVTIHRQLNLFQNKRPAAGGTLNRIMPPRRVSCNVRRFLLFMEVVRSPGFRFQTMASHRLTSKCPQASSQTNNVDTRKE